MRRRLTPREQALVEEFDVDFMCEGLNTSPAEAREAIRVGIAAGLLRIDGTSDQITLTGTFPDEGGRP